MEDAQLLRMELEAMTWAAWAKDAAILSLQRKLRAKQEEVDSFAQRSTRLEKELEAARSREDSLWRKVEHMKVAQEKLEDAEERLCAQLGQLEVEYIEQARSHKLQIQRLMEELQHKENALLASSDAQMQRTETCESLSASLQKKTEEFDALQRKFEDTKTCLLSTQAELTEAKRRIEAQDSQAAQGPDLMLKDRPKVAPIMKIKAGGMNFIVSSYQRCNKPVENLA